MIAIRPFLYSLFCQCHRESKRCAGLRIQQADALSMHFHDALANGQAQSCTLARGVRPVRREETLENA